jgi:hypothetical protein
VSKPAIPRVPLPGQTRGRFDEVVKEVLDAITGQTTGKLAKLPETASNAEIIAKINELIDRLQ